MYHANLNNFCIDSVSVFLTHLPLLDICQDKSVVFIILSQNLLEDKLGLFSIEKESLFTAVCHSVFPSFCHSVNLSRKFNLATNFSTLNARVLLFHMIILCDTRKIFCRLLEILEKNDIGQNFLKIKIKASTIQMVISCDKIVLL